MANVNDELCEKLYKYGKQLTPVVEIAALVDMDEQTLESALENRLSPLRKAYMRGLAETGEELRTQMIEAVHAGSPSAIEQALYSLRQCQRL